MNTLMIILLTIIFLLFMYIRSQSSHMRFVKLFRTCPCHAPETIRKIEESLRKKAEALSATRKDLIFLKQASKNDDNVSSPKAVSDFIEKRDSLEFRKETLEKDFLTGLFLARDFAMVNDQEMIEFLKIANR